MNQRYRGLINSIAIRLRHPYQGADSSMKKGIGLSFSKDRMTAVAVRPVGSELILLDAVVVPIAVSDGLRQELPNSYAAPLQEFVRRNRLRSWPVVISIPNEWVIVRYMTTPDVPVPAIRQMVQVELGNTIHLPFDDPVYDVAQVRSLTTIDEGMQNIVLVAAPRGMINSALQIVQSVGLRPHAIEIEPIALWRYAEQLLGNLLGLTVLIDIHETSVTFALFVDDTLYFFRETESSFSVVPDGEDQVRRLCNDLAYELERVMNFFNFSLAKGNQIQDRTLLHTYFINDALLTARLQEQIGLPITSIPSKSTSMDGFSLFQQDVDVSLMSAVGLALRGHTL